MERFDTVDAYLAACSDDGRERLQRMCALVREAAPDVVEGMWYGMPGYKLGGRPLVYFGAFARHWSVFPAGDVDRLGAPLTARVASHRKGKGTLQFRYEEPFLQDLLQAIVVERVRQNRAPQS